MQLVLVRAEEKQQRPVYYPSRVLKGVEHNYNRIEKAAYAVVITTRRLRPYFQTHSVVVLTSPPLQINLEQLEKSARMINWEVELSEFDVHYKPRLSINAQVLADFIVECTIEKTEDEEDEEDPQMDEGVCILYVDGSSTESRNGAGVVLEGPKEKTFEYALRFTF
jgi:hypothetical protein